MKELLSYLTAWTEHHRPFALARVIQTWGSSPRPVGSTLLISDNLEMAGSVSGGCVEGAVLKEAGKIIISPAGKILSYGVSDDEAWAVGLTCGGKIRLYIQSYPFDRPDQLIVWQTLQTALAENRNCVLVTSLEVGDSTSSLVLLPGHEVVGPSIPAEVIAKALEAYANRKHSIILVDHQEYFIQVFPRRNQLLIIGAAHITVDLVQLAALHDFETIVIDPRGVFARQTQFKVPPDHLLEKYPSDVLQNFILDGYTYAVVLSHDPKIDDNALQILLRSKVAYIGALGSRKTHEKRRERLSKVGFSEVEIDRIESPVGMDIHAQGAKEIALSIMGSIIRVKNSFL